MAIFTGIVAAAATIIGSFSVGSFISAGIGLIPTVGIAFAEPAATADTDV